MKTIKVKIRWSAESSGMWYENLVDHTFKVTKNPTMDYHTVIGQGKIIFKVDTV